MGERWRVVSRNLTELRKKTRVDVRLRIAEIPNNLFVNFRARETSILNGINSVLVREGAGWRVEGVGGRSIFVNRQEIRFALIPTGTVPVILGVALTGKAILLILGVFITGVVVERAGRTIWGGSGPLPTQQDLREIFHLVPEEERSEIIRRYVESALVPRQDPGPLGEVQGVVGSIIILVVILFVGYAIIQTGALENVKKRN